MDSVVGIDLSGVSAGTKGRTVAAQLSLESRPRLMDLRVIPRGPRGDADLLTWIEERRPCVVAIDAPLTLPHSVLCEDPDCPRCQPGEASYTERDVDAMARAQGGGMPSVMLAAIVVRGIYLGRRIRCLGIPVIECYPAAAFRAMGVTGKSVTEREAVLGQSVDELEWSTAVRLEDQVDAVCAALVGLDYAMGGRNAIAGEDGAIWLPTPTPS